MKSVFVGGGSHRLLGILRGAMAVPGVFDGGEINLYDLNTHRSGTVGKMLMKTPEHRRCGCKITWGTSLDEALEGAGMVGVILMSGSQKTYRLGDAASLRNHYMASDNVSPNGAMLAVKGGPILLNVARRMECVCPGAVPVRIELLDPSGIPSPLSGNYATRDGSFVLKWLPATNDPHGKWKIQVEELASGLKSEASENLEK